MARTRSCLRQGTAQTARREPGNHAGRLVPYDVGGTPTHPVIVWGAPTHLVILSGARGFAGESLLRSRKIPCLRWPVLSRSEGRGVREFIWKRWSQGVGIAVKAVRPRLAIHADTREVTSAAATFRVHPSSRVMSSNPRRIGGRSLHDPGAPAKQPRHWNTGASASTSYFSHPIPTTATRTTASACPL